MNGMDSEASKKVVIGKATYSLDRIPGSETKLVKDERSKLLGNIDLRSLVQDLGHVGRCIQLAYHGMVAAGPECVKLQIEVQRLGYDVTRLCDKSAVTVSQFKRASTTILTDLQATYGYLLDGFEDMALETLSSVSDLAGQMAKAAEELHNSFDEQARKVERVLEKTQETEADKELTARQRETDRENLETKIERGNELLKKAQENEEEAELIYRECELKEDEAIQNFEDEGNIFQRLINGLTSKYMGFTAMGYSQWSQEMRYKAIDKKKVQALKLRMERERERIQAFQNITELTVDLQSCKNEGQFAKSSAKALHKAVEGLKILAALMMHAARFWKQMQEHFKELSDTKLKNEVARAVNQYDDKKRLKLWTSHSFKIQAVRFYAGWVALDSVCGEYMEAIKETQKELYKYIQENPTQKEAEKNVRDLAGEFQKDLEDAQRACIERGSVMEEQIRELTMEN